MIDPALPGVRSDSFDLVVAYGSLKTAKASQTEAMSFCHRGNFLNAFQLNVFAERETFVSPFQGQDNRLGHTRICHARWEAKVEMKIYRSWHLDHPAFNYQHIVALLDDSA
jgi:hypothetical protein